jgi:hypothetical protein
MTSPADRPAAPPPGARSLGRTQWLVALGGLVALALGVWLVASRLPGLLSTAPVEEGAPPAPAHGAPPPADARKIHATLFYVTDDGTALAPSSLEVPYAPTSAEQARRLVEAQVGPPPANAASAIPAGTTVRAVYVTPRGEAFVDLSREMMSGHSGGSLNEALAVYAIVNALTVNLPEVVAVQILIAGTEVDSLAGHLDLRHPLGRGLQWIRR